jgi:nitrate/nitrite-specific signal transduction histidine kinase
MLKKTTIKNRLIIIIVMVVCSGVFSGIFYYLFLKRIHAFHDTESALNDVIHDLNALRSYETNYLQTMLFPVEDSTVDTLYNKKNLDIQIGNISDDINNIVEEDSFLRKRIYMDPLHDVISLLHVHSRKLEELLSLLDERGNQNTGEIGSLLQASENFYSLVVLAPDTGTREKALEYSRHLNPYLISFNTEYSDKILQLFNDLGNNGRMDSLAFLQLNISMQQIADVIKLINRKNKLTGFSGRAGLQYQSFSLLDDIEANIRITLTRLQASLNNYTSKIALIIIIAVLVISVIIAFFLYRITHSIIVPMGKVRTYIKVLASGKIPGTLNLEQDDEVTAMSRDLSLFTGDLKDKSRFAEKIGSGNLGSKYTPLGKEDNLGNALIQLEQNLADAKEEEQKYKVEEKKRRWVNEGLAKFSDILRMNNDNLNEFSALIIQNLVKYLNAEQGSFFLLDDNEDNTTLVLSSSFAMNRRKYKDQELQLGEGLVGTCAIEKSIIYLEEIPDDYIIVSSGLGNAKPKSLLIAPLKLEEEVLGVVEIASFQKFKPHEIDFIEKITESIASTLKAVKMNEQTRLLLEQTKSQADEMAQKEEEMRQNMEELQATQEESQRREQELSGMIAAMNNSVWMAELDGEARILNLNEKMRRAFGLKNNDLENEAIWKIPTLTGLEEELPDNWKEITDGKTIDLDVEQKIEKNLKFITFNFTPVMNDNNELVKVILIGIEKASQHIEGLRL